MFDNPLALALAALLAIYLTIFSWSRPRFALTVWIICLVAVPVWPELRVGVALQPLSALSLLLVPAIIRNWRGPIRPSDWLMLSFAAATTISVAFFSAPQFAWIAVFSQWGAAYLVGRTLGPAVGEGRAYRALAIAGTVVGIWALAEFVLGLHLFEGYLVAFDQAGWHTIQIRGSFARSEGAFGHSIAMGGFLALCVPFVIACKTTTLRRIVMLIFVTAGGLVTFSRGAIIGVAAAIVLSLLFMASESLTRRARTGLILAATLASAIAVPLTLNIFTSVSSDLTVSTNYRGELSTSFIPDLNMFGLGDGVQFVDGAQRYRQFTSIDNAYALLGLQLGWVPLLILVGGVLAVAVRLVRGRGGPADVALVSQAIVLYTVALITQYGLAVFFVVGLAAAFGPQRKRTVSDRSAHFGNHKLSTARGRIVSLRG